MVKPSAIKPYMLPRPKPLISADISIYYSPDYSPDIADSGGYRSRPPPRHHAAHGSIGHGYRQNAVVDKSRPHIIVLMQRVMHGGAERLDVSLDQAVVAVNFVEPFADSSAIGGACLGDRERHQMHAVICIGDAHGRGDVIRPLDVRIFVFQ